MRLSFDSIDEVKDFVKGLKGTRGGKGGSDDEGQPGTGQAPPPLAPPIGGNPLGAAGFPGAVQGGAFPAVTNGPAPEVLALVQRIAARTTKLIQEGQSADQMLTWFRGQCGPEAAQATLDQIQQVFLPRASVPTLENIVKLTGA